MFCGNVCDPSAAGAAGSETSYKRTVGPSETYAIPSCRCTVVAGPGMKPTCSRLRVWANAGASRAPPTHIATNPAAIHVFTGYGVSAMRYRWEAVRINRLPSAIAGVAIAISSSALLPSTS